MEPTEKKTRFVDTIEDEAIRVWYVIGVKVLLLLLFTVFSITTCEVTEAVCGSSNLRALERRVQTIEARGDGR